jgi:hypothetical protein
VTYAEEPVSNQFIQIANSGQAVKSTNYFDTVAAARGQFFLSWNAGAGRLLVPDSEKLTVREMRSADYVIVTSGCWSERGGITAVELLSEDNSDTPFVVTLPASQCDRMLPATDSGSAPYISVWTRGGQELRLPGRFRHGHELPCLMAWESHEGTRLSPMTTWR